MVNIRTGRNNKKIQMNTNQFIKDLKAYLVDYELSEMDVKKISAIFERHSGEDIVVYKDKIVYQNKIVYRDIFKTAGIVGNGLINEKTYNIALEMRDNIIKFWKMDEADVLGERRHQQLVYCRFHCYLVLRRLGITFKEIGRMFGKDHSSVMHGITNANNMLETKSEPFYSMFNYWVNNDSQIRFLTITNETECQNNS